MDFTQYQRLNDLICSQNTGTVEDLAKKLNVSPRKVKYMISTMRVKCESPILFDNRKKSYIYTQDGCCNFKFKKSNKEIVTSIVNDILKKAFPVLILILNILSGDDTIIF